MRAKAASASWKSVAAYRPTTSKPTTNTHTASVNHPLSVSSRLGGRNEPSNFMKLFHHTAGRPPTDSHARRHRTERHPPFYHSDRNRLRGKNRNLDSQAQVQRGSPSGCRAADGGLTVGARCRVS